MNRIEIRGIIVPSMYDDEYFWPYIQRGIITPESYCRKKIAQASKNEPLEVYINSQGGSVFAGNEMINALREWKMASKQPVHVIVGAIAASMASAITVFAADKVSIHQNSKIMFHGVITETAGGEGAHKDALELIGKMNAELRTVLISRFNLSPEKVDMWFEEGRMGWLDAKEAKQIGLADEIIGLEDSENADAGIMVRQMEQGMKLAACLETINTGEKMIAKIKALFGLDEKMVEADVEKFVETLKKPESIKAAADVAYDEGKNAGIIEGRKLQGAEAEIKIAEYEAKLKDFTAQIAALSAENTEIKAKHEKLSAGLKAPEGDVVPRDYFAEVKALESEGMTYEEASLKVRREKPELFKAMIVGANKR